MSYHPVETDQNAVETLLGQRLHLNWEVAVYVVILIIAVLTRFMHLGDRVMSHDESLHTRFSWNLYDSGNFQHTPLMHGPILFHMVALSYSIFGDSDFSARIYTAVVGVMMVMSPLLFRYWLKPWGAILVSIGILISPLLMYYHRYIREDTPTIMAGILMIWAILMYLSGPPRFRYKTYWYYVLAFGMIWNLGTKETAFMDVAILGIFLALFWFVRMAQHFMAQQQLAFNGKRAFMLLAFGGMLGAVMSLGTYIVLDVIQFDMFNPVSGFSFHEMPANQQTTYLLWTALVVLVMLFVIVSTAAWGYLKAGRRRLPWGQMAFVAGVMLASGFVLVIVEELSHTTAGKPDAVAQPLRWFPLVATWVVCILVCAFFIVFRRRPNDVPADRATRTPGTGLWGFLDLFPEFDLMVVIGTLILPWAAALIPYVMGGTTDDFAAIGRSWGLLAAVVQTFPNPMATAGQNVWQDYQVGQVLLGFMAWLPLFITMFVIGLSWNRRQWLITAAIFHSIFAFFFTTMFTNLYGLMTGMYYSLGYWLEQQGVRRGSQPQYYYLLVIMPMYEFLAIAGSVGAMFAGLTIFWRRAAQEDQTEEALEAHIIAEAEKRKRGIYAEAQLAEEANSDLSPDAVPMDGVQPSTFRGDRDEEAAQPDLRAAAGAETLVIAQNRTDAADSVERLYELRQSQRLEELPFLITWGWVAVFNLILLTLAGEKMPWLATHMTLPMLFISGWFVSRIVVKLDLKEFAQRGWIQVLLMVVVIIAGLRVVGAFVVGDLPFRGLEVSQLRATNNWLLALIGLVTAGGLLVWLSRGAAALRRIAAVAFFGFLAFLTARAAWMASFINYDYPTEYLVYAHSAPAVKTVLNMIDELSLRLTDGNELVFAYDNEVSWPYSWYFRNYPRAVYFDTTPTNQRLQDAVVVIAGDGNRARVEAIIEDRYQHYRFVRMWWPTEDYKYLTVDRINNLLDFSPTNAQAAQIRRGIFDIWWARDYTQFGLAVGKNFSLPSWPVQNAMNVWVRKDVVAQIWSFGTGGGLIENPLDNLPVNQCNANFQDLQPIQVLTSAPIPMARPLAMAFGPDGNLYVAEEGNHRISVFDPTTGAYLASYGVPGNSLERLELNRPNSITFDAQGNPIIVDTWNFRVQKVSPDFAEIATVWGQMGLYGLQAPTVPTDGFWGPRDAKVDARGRVLVMDTGNKRLRVYEIVDGVAVWSFDIGRGGSGPGELDEPTSLVIHPVDGRIFIADMWNQRIAVFTSEGQFLTNYPVRAWLQKTGNAPYLALDVNRNLLYATDPDAGRVLVYTIDGECVGSFGSLALTSAMSNQFGLASGIVVDADGFVYVSDAALGRILKFPPFPVQGTAAEPALAPLQQALPLIDELAAEEITEEAEATAAE
jgi:predicted membrane-bound mannosyltransferase/DNA-binding beta-propeller fold protein YncE